jgi:hypothetical protein
MASWGTAKDGLLQQISGLFRTQVIPAVVGISHGGTASLEPPERKNYNRFRVLKKPVLSRL